MYGKSDSLFDLIIGQSVIRLSEYSGKGAKLIWFMISLLMLLLLGFIDYSAVPGLTFYMFYLVPVFIAVWFVGKWAGFAMCFISCIIWFFKDNLYDIEYNTIAFIPYWNLLIKCIFILLISYLFYLLKYSFGQHQKFATTDYLTKLTNRRCFIELLKTEAKKANRKNNAITIAYLDLDNFKNINDSHGHKTGDKLLIKVAQSISENISNVDLAARFGGDEFVILFPKTGFKTAQVKIKIIKNNILDVMRKNGWPVTASIGAVTFTRPSTETDKLINMPDKLMYEAKKSGKNKIRHEICDSIIK